ncbi:MAG: manganese efflux pump [Oscillibacter sp.]|nr:manganese efflux pump [Oscillibacter sp.]
MRFSELLLIAIGLSMDAFAVAICQGLAMPRLEGKRAGVIALYFGGFQALMPLLGWLLGSRLAAYIRSVDHWAVFILLGLIGANMIREAFGKKEEEDASDAPLDHRRLLALAVATSIDALAVGVTFAFLSVSILPAVGVIGATTFLLSLVGVAVGNWFGARWEKYAEFTGGVILILLGTKILLEHLGIF